MIVHYLKIMWKSKYKNAFLLFQFFLVFLILFGVISYGVEKYNFYKKEVGYDTQNVLKIGIGYQAELDSLEIDALGNQIKSGLKSLPEIVEVSFTEISPYSGFDRRRGKVGLGSVDQNFFKVLNMKFVSGQNFEDSDIHDNKVIVNQKFMDELNSAYQSEESDYIKIIKSVDNIIGVVEAYKKDGPFSEDEAFVFYLQKAKKRVPSIIVKIKSDSKPHVEKKIADLLKNVTKNENISILNIDNSRLVSFKENIVPLSGMAFLAIFLIINIAMGLFGVLRYTISKRKSEIGLRKALGATNSEIKKQFVGEIVVLVTLALLVALFFAVQLPFITTLPFSTENYISGIVLGTALVYFVVFVCSYFPSREAAQTLPANALHEN